MYLTLLGADAVADDGIYARVFNKFRGKGRYNMMVSIENK